MRWLAAALLLCPVLCPGAAGAAAQQTQPYVRGSQQAILAAHRDQPFILALWSLDCTHCRDDLEILGSLQAKYPALKVVLVSTDTPDREAELQSVIGRYALQRSESWVFADDYTERLRHQVDPGWYGELPRTYFFAADGMATAQSGKIGFDATERWINLHVGAAGKGRR
ncbi:MAG TPA: TlpA family protein disulfide reductase [Gallionella sp.]